ncbi:ran-binding protein 3 [Pteropus vampyrus]|uniref:Ran-binding protein 3 n=1 Tax=Pteropus vampyrus TaxID=132908 RepID=A0A6P6D3S0_PTEVA|nr:ran-binding protein 3 [Pteropus vampyrus]
MADLANEEKPAIAPPVFVFQKDKGQKSSAEQKDLSDSGEEPQGEAEAPHHGTGHPESAGEHALEPPAPASASASAPEAQLPPFPQELAGEVRKAAAFTPAYYLCVCRCQLLRQSPTPSPALDWHLCPPRGHTRQPYKSYVFFWRKMIFNKCNNRNFHHFFLYTKNRSFPPLQSHPGLDITSNFVLGDGDRAPWRVASSARCRRFMGEVLSVRLKVCDGWVAELGEFALSAGFRDLRIMELALRSAGGSSPEGGEDSDREDGSYCPPVKRERTSSLTQFPPSQSVSKNNVFMPSTFCEPSAGNSDSEPEEKSSGFRLKPPTLIHGQAPSAGLPSQKPKEQQRSVLRPAVLQAPQPKALSQTVPSSGTNGLSVPADCAGATTSTLPDSPARRRTSDEAPAPEEKEPQKTESSNTSEEDSCEEKEPVPQQAFVFGQNLRDRVKVRAQGPGELWARDSIFACLPQVQQQEPGQQKDSFLFHRGNSMWYLLAASQAAVRSTAVGRPGPPRHSPPECFISLQSPPKLNEVSSDANRENSAAESGSESSSQEATPEKESLAESAAAYTKATARKCLLEKVEVITGEEAESNVLQIQCKLFVFDKTSQSWVERGRGLLRLNDMASTDDGTLQSRLVMRTQGSLRLILNTKLWAQMQIDKASEKSIRITAMDTEDQGVKVFLISASSKDTGQLYAALHHRILALRSRVEQEQEAKTPAPEPGAAPSNEDYSDDDDVLAPSGAAAGGAGDEGDGQTAGST